MPKLTLSLWSILLVFLQHVSGQTALVQGKLMDQDTPAPYARIICMDGCDGALSDMQGAFTLRARKDTLLIEIRAFGFETVKGKYAVASFPSVIQLSADPFFIEEVVVTTQRRPTSRQEAIVPASVVTNRDFSTYQAQNLAEGIGFASGLRLENNCQNCGFTQVRMNGLPGPYTQILINSRPLFSALSGVYGLDQIPAVMIEQIEVVRGAGSVLYGGNAIAGTVNILTRKPSALMVDVGARVALTGGSSWDQNLHAYAAVPVSDQNEGFSVYAFQRNREPWDANADGFSEITQLNTLSFGMDAVRKLSKRARLTANGYAIREQRRGGSDFELEPHQAEIAEALDHRVFGGGLTLDAFSPNLKHKWQVYANGQATKRGSYYGAGGRVLAPEDSLTADDFLALNAYGQTTDLVTIAGAQHTWEPSNRFLITSGAETIFNRVDDQMPGYGRRIFQTAHTTGVFSQIEAKPVHGLVLLTGARAEWFRLQGDYALGGAGFEQKNNLLLFAPRVSVRWNAPQQIVLRAGYAQGYRAPQAFDEDLHIETVGGAARFTQLAEDLQTERSHGFTGSLEYTLSRGAVRTEWVAEGFLTRLSNPFITADPVELPEGISVLTKRNGAGATVAGVNLEGRLGMGSRWEFQSGFTFQSARYDEEEMIWSPEVVTDLNADSVVSTLRILRAPRAYGFVSAIWRLPSKWEASFTGTYTGSMVTPHVIDPGTEFTRLAETPRFFDAQVRVERALALNAKEELRIAAGVKNLFNQFQRDFDIGPERDASYVYGPAAPRTFVLEVRWIWGN